MDVQRIREETELAEAVLLRARRLGPPSFQVPTRIMRLPDGQFAPKGSGEVLTPGSRVQVEHASGIVGHGHVVDVTGGRATVAITHGPGAGRRVVSAASHGEAARPASERQPLPHVSVSKTEFESAVLRAKRTPHGGSFSIHLPEGAIHVTRNERRLKDPGYHVSGGGAAVDPDLRRGPRQLVTAGATGREVAERVASTLAAEQAHTDEHARRVEAAKGAAPVRLTALNGHEAMIRAHPKGGFAVEFPDKDLKPVVHPSAAAAVEHAKGTLRRRKGAKFLEEGHDTDPLSTLSSSHMVATAAKTSTAAAVGRQAEHLEKLDKIPDSTDVLGVGEHMQKAGGIPVPVVKVDPEAARHELASLGHHGSAAAIHAVHAAVFPHVEHAAGMAYQHAGMVVHHATLAVHLLQGEEQAMGSDELMEFWSAQARMAALASRRAHHGGRNEGLIAASHRYHQSQLAGIRGLAAGAADDALRTRQGRDADELVRKGIRSHDDALLVVRHRDRGFPDKNLIREVYRKHGVALPPELREDAALFMELAESDWDLLWEAKDSLLKAKTPEPFSASRTSNWIARGGGLPPYVQRIAHDLMEKRGMDESRAISMAIGIVKRWARGGGSVDNNTRAAAALAVSQWEKLKLKAHAKSAVKAAGKVVEAHVPSYRRKGRLVHGYERLLGGVTYPHPVRADSSMFGDDQYGHVQGVSPGGLLHVRIEDPGEDHPAALDMAADGVPYDQQEHVDVIHHSKVRDAGSGRTLGNPDHAAEQLRSDVRRERAVADNAARMAKLGKVKPRRNELDSGLRSKVSESERRSIFHGALTELGASPELGDVWLCVAEGAEGPLERVPGAVRESLREAWAPAARRAALAARLRRTGGHLSLDGVHVVPSASHLEVRSPYARTVRVPLARSDAHERAADAVLRHQRAARPDVIPDIHGAFSEMTGRLSGARVSEAARSRKSRTGKYTNVFHGTDKPSRSHGDLMDEVAAAGHAGGGVCSNCGKDHSGPCRKVAEGQLAEAWSEAARKAALEARRRKAHAGFRKAFEDLPHGGRVKYRGVYLEKEKGGMFGDKLKVSASGGGGVGTFKNLDNAAEEAMGVSARSAAKDSLGGPKSHKPKTMPMADGESSASRSKRYREAAIASALDAEPDDAGGFASADRTAAKSRERAERESARRKRSRDARTAVSPAEREVNRRVTMRQVGGDDGYQYHVLVDGRSVANGLTRREAEYHRDQHRKRLLKGS